MNLKKNAASALALALIASMVVPAYASTYSDIQKHWAKASIERLSGYGAISGYQGKFRPNDYITRGEMAVVVANLMQYQTKGSTKFSDLDNNFYRDAIMKLNGANVMSGSDGLVRPKDRITRQEAIVMLANAFGMDQNSSASYGFSDSGKIASWSRGAIGALASKGFVTGDNGKQLRPGDPITRGELVSIVDRMVGSYANTAGTKTANTSSNAVVTVDGVEFDGAKIAGNIVITDNNKGVTTLEDTTVGGKVITNKNMKELRVRGDSSINNVETRGAGTIALDVSSTASVKKMTVRDTKTVNLTGSVKEIIASEDANTTLNVENNEGSSIEVRAAQTKVNVKGYSDISNISISKDADESTISIAKDAKIGKIVTEGEDTRMTINGSVDEIHVKEDAEKSQLNFSTGDNDVDELVIDAEDVKVSGNGVVRKIYVNASGVNINVKDATVYVGRNAENVIVGGEKVKPGATVNSSNVEDDTDWDEIKIESVEVQSEDTIIVTLDNNNEKIEEALKKTNFEITGKKSSTKDPAISSVSVKNSSDVDDNTVYQIKLSDDLKDDTDYKLTIYLPDGSTETKNFSTGDLSEDEYPEISDVTVTRISATQAEIDFEASEDGDMWYIVEKYSDSSKPSASDIKDDGEEEDVDDGDNEITISGLTSGEKYKLYMVTKNRTTSKVYGPFTIPENTLVQSTTIKEFKYNEKFTIELNDVLASDLTTSNVSIVGPNGALTLSSVTKVSSTKYEVATSTKMVDGTYTLKITFADSTQRQSNIVVDVPEEAPAVAPSVSELTIDRIASNDKKVAIQFKADEAGKAYIMEGRGNADAVVESGKEIPVSKGSNGLTFTMSAADIDKISIVTVSTDGTVKSTVYTVNVPELEADEPSDGDDNQGQTPGEGSGDQGQTPGEGSGDDNDDENAGQTPSEPSGDGDDENNGNGGNAGQTPSEPSGDNGDGDGDGDDDTTGQTPSEPSGDNGDGAGQTPSEPSGE